MTFLLRAFVGGLVLPAAIAFACFTLMSRSRRLSAESSTLLGAALALGLGFLCAAWATDVIPFKPEDPFHWLPYISLLAAALGFFALSSRAPGLTLCVLMLIPAGLAAYLMVPDWPRIAEQRQTYQLLFPLCILAWCGLAPIARQSRGMFLPLLLCVAAACAAALMELCGLASFAQLGGAVVAILIGTAVAAWRLPDRNLVYGLVPGLACLVPGLVISGKITTHSEEIPTASFVLVLIAPLCLWLSWIPMLRKMPAPWLRVLEAALVILPAGLAVLLAALAETEEW